MRAKFLPNGKVRHRQVILSGPISTVKAVLNLLLVPPLEYISTKRLAPVDKKEGLAMGMLLEMVSEKTRLKVLELHNGDAKAAEAWMGKENPLLGGNTPFGVAKMREGEPNSGEDFLYQMMDRYTSDYARYADRSQVG